LVLSSSSWWATFRVITVDNSDVIAIRTINPTAMPRIRFLIEGRSMRTELWRMGGRKWTTAAKARPIGPDRFFSLRR
jgi:hypothetical protein